MKIKDIQSVTAAEAASGIFRPDEEIKGAYVCDVLSSALAKTGPGTIWITMRHHMNVLGVAAAKGISAVIMAETGSIDTALLDKAREEKINLFLSKETGFELSGKIYLVLQNDNQGGTQWNRKASRISTRA